MNAERETPFTVLPAVRRIGAMAPLEWLRLAAADLAAHPFASAFYGACSRQWIGLSHSRSVMPTPMFRRW